MLLRRLDASGPFLVVATLWPVYDKTLSSRPAPDALDPHWQVRALLAQARYIYVPDSFAGGMEAVRSAAKNDRSLAAGLDAGGTDLTQALAAGLDLAEHYEYPSGEYGVYGKALISAAMDAHRFGVGESLPLDFLREAAPGYLNGRERAEANHDWYLGALNYARALIKNVTRPLQDVPRSSGMGARPGVVRLADYLQQLSRARWTLYPPSTFWEAAAQHLTSTADRTSLADAASVRCRRRDAAELYSTAADDPGALRSMAALREKVGDWQEAERLYRAAIDAGYMDGLGSVVWMWDRAGDWKKAVQAAHEVADTAGDPMYLRLLAYTREQAGDRAEAERLYTLAAEAGDTKALRGLATMRELAGDREEAERFAQQAAQAGDTDALAELAKAREQAGDRAEAERLYTLAAEAGDTKALRGLATMRELAGDREEAERLAQQAAQAGDTKALQGLATMRE